MATTTNSMRNIQIHHLVTLKLTETNHSLWKTQFKPILKGYGLTGFIDGSKAIPPKTLPDSDEINPLYTDYEAQGSLIVGWLNSTLTPEVLCHVRGLDTAKSVWDKLESYFAPKTRAHMMSLKKQLHSMNKGNKSLKTYLTDAKNLFEQLAATGYDVSNDEKMQSISNGLNQSYDPIVTALSTKDDMDMETFYSHLLTFDMRIEQQLSSIQQPAVNVDVSRLTPQFKSSSKMHQQNRGSQNHFSNQNPQYQFNNQQKRFNMQQRGQQSTNTSEEPCQICKKDGHQASRCWFRYEKSSTPKSKNPAAYIDLPGSDTTNNWVTDSGATHHMTSDFRNLSIPPEYDGTEQVQVGNGQYDGGVVAARPE